MRIDNVSASRAYEKVMNGLKKPDPKAPDAASGTEKAAADRIEFSGESRRKADALAFSSLIKSDIENTYASKDIDAIAQRVKEGVYAVSGADVADAMLWRL